MVDGTETPSSLCTLRCAITASAGQVRDLQVWPSTPDSRPSTLPAPAGSCLGLDQPLAECRRRFSFRVQSLNSQPALRYYRGRCGGSGRIGFAIRHEIGESPFMQGLEPKSSRPVQREVLSGPGPGAGYWSPGPGHQSGNAAGRTTVGRRVVWAIRQIGLAELRLEDGTHLLSPVTRTSPVQRFSSTAVYPTIRGPGLPCFPTLAGRGLRDTLLPR